MEERGGESESGRERWEVEEWRRGGEGESGRVVGRGVSGREWWGGVGVEESGGEG